MNQFLGKDDGKWHITMFVDIPRVVIRNQLNFRLYSTTSTGGTTTKDPSIINSTYVFHITPNLLGRKVFFNVSFAKAAIANVSTFRFGLCDEMIGWHHATLFDVKNEYSGEIILSDVVRPAPAITKEIITPTVDIADVPIIVSEQEPEIIEEYVPIAEPAIAMIEPAATITADTQEVLETEKEPEEEDIEQTTTSTPAVPVSAAKTYQKKAKRK